MVLVGEAFVEVSGSQRGFLADAAHRQFGRVDVRAQQLQAGLQQSVTTLRQPIGGINACIGPRLGHRVILTARRAWHNIRKQALSDSAEGHAVTTAEYVGLADRPVSESSGPPAGRSIFQWLTRQTFGDGIPGIALLAGPANVIMQLGHPAVGYGVMESRVESGRSTGTRSNEPAPLSPTSPLRPAGIPSSRRPTAKR